MRLSKGKGSMIADTAIGADGDNVFVVVNVCYHQCRFHSEGGVAVGGTVGFAGVELKLCGVLPKCFTLVASSSVVFSTKVNCLAPDSLVMR